MKHRLVLTTALLVTAALGAGVAASLEGVADDGQAQPPVPLPDPQDAAPPPAPPAPEVLRSDAPQGARPIDEKAFRALADEVARLRGRVDRLEAEAAQRAAVPPIEPFTRSDGGAAPSAPPVVQEPAVVERTVERVVEVEREVPVYVDREVIVETSPTIVVEQTVEAAPTVIYEQVVWRDASCWQTIPYGHVHSIGCGHHYYGCACHPWYYDLHGGGLDIRFVHVDVDRHHHHHHGRGDGRRDGRWDGHRDGRHGDGRRDFGNRDGGRRESAPSEPVRRLDGGGDRRGPGPGRSDRPGAATLENRTPAAPSGATSPAPGSPGRADAPARRTPESLPQGTWREGVRDGTDRDGRRVVRIGPDADERRGPRAPVAERPAAPSRPERRTVTPPVERRRDAEPRGERLRGGDDAPRSRAPDRGREPQRPQVARTPPRDAPAPRVPPAVRAEPPRRAAPPAQPHRQGNPGHRGRPGRGQSED